MSVPTQYNSSTDVNPRKVEESKDGSIVDRFQGHQSMSDERAAMLERRRMIELEKKKMRMQGPHIVPTVRDDQRPRPNMIPYSVNNNTPDIQSKTNYIHETRAQPLRSYPNNNSQNIPRMNQYTIPKPDYQPHLHDVPEANQKFYETKQETKQGIREETKSDNNPQRMASSNVYKDYKQKPRQEQYNTAQQRSRDSDGESSDGGYGGGNDDVEGNMIDSDSSDNNIPHEHISFRGLEDKKVFLSSPLPRRFDTIQCRIARKRTGFLLTDTIYELYLKEGNQYLLSSKKKPNNRTSNYYITFDKNDLGGTGQSFLGKLRSNFSGTEFVLYGPGKNPKDTDEDVINSNPAIVREEKAVVTYEINIFGSKGPRKMTVLIPQLINDKETVTWRPLKEKDCLSDRYRHNSLNGMMVFRNRDPQWNDSVGAYTLNFNGRVTMASVKNFQLTPESDRENIVLQFGRIGKDDFSLDFKYPFSPFQAFSICLSSFDSKLLCE